MTLPKNNINKECNLYQYKNKKASPNKQQNNFKIDFASH